MSSITLNNLNKTYPNGFLSVKNVSLFIEDGEFVTFHGPSGCGKSTILRMIGGLEEITSGEIYLGDLLLNEVLPRDRRLAMAFQNYALYPGLNVYENISLQLVFSSMLIRMLGTETYWGMVLCTVYSDAEFCTPRSGCSLDMGIVLTNVL